PSPQVRGDIAVLLQLMCSQRLFPMRDASTLLPLLVADAPSLQSPPDAALASQQGLYGLPQPVWAPESEYELASRSHAALGAPSSAVFAPGSHSPVLESRAVRQLVLYILHWLESWQQEQQLQGQGQGQAGAGS